MQQIKLKNGIVSAQAYADYLLIESDSGWTVLIPPQDAITYWKNYHAAPGDTVKIKGGFSDIGSNVVLTHRDGKISFPRSDAITLFDLIRVASQGVWQIVCG